MPGVLPKTRTSNFSANRKAVENSRTFVRGSVNLGNKAFNAMFPTIGKLLGSISSKPEQDKIRTTTRRNLESVDDGLVRNNASLSEVLNNQNIQNNLLTQLLNLYKSTPGGAAAILPQTPGPELPDIITMPRVRPPAPSTRTPSPSARPPAQASRPTVPNTRPASPPAAAARSAVNSFLRFAGPITAIATFYAGMRDLGNNSINVNVNIRQTFNRTLNSFKENLDNATRLYDSLRAETDPDRARELEIDLTRILDNMKSQRARLVEAARALDAAIAVEIERQKKRGNIINRPNYMEKVLSLPEADFDVSADIEVTVSASAPGSSTAATPEPTNIPPSVNPPLQITAPAAPPVVPSIPQTTSGTVAVAGISAVTPPPAPTNVNNPPSPPSVTAPPRPVSNPVNVPSPPTVSAPRAPTQNATAVAAPPIVAPPPAARMTESPATPVVNSDQIQILSANTNYEKIVFEADTIKFDGPFNIQQTASVVNQPNFVSSSGTGQTAQTTHSGHGGSTGGSGSSGTSSTVSGGGASSGGGGPMATQVSASAPTGASTPPVTGTTAQILATIRQKESGSNYQAQSRSSSASGAYQFINSTWQSLTRQFNIGTEYNRAVEAPPAIQDAVAAAYVNQILSRNNNDVSVVPLVWYTGNPQGRISEAAVAANRGLTPQRYQTEWMQLFASMGGSVPANTAQTQIASAPSSGPALTQASTQRVAVDRQQVAANQRLTSELQQQGSRTTEQQNAGSASADQNRGGGKSTTNEVPLKIRILSTFEQLNRT